MRKLLVILNSMLKHGTPSGAHHLYIEAHT
jgi:hypothetical protein